MKNLKKSFFSIFVLFSGFCGFSASNLIKFENPQINSESKILYTIEHNLGGENYKTLFLTDATKSQNTKILTCYPEKMELLSGGAVLQIRNRYGTARYSVADENLTWIAQEESLPTAAKGMTPALASTSGKWICFLKKTGPASAKLILKNSFTFQEFVIDEDAEFDYEKIPVKWCPGKELFLYEKNVNGGKSKNIYFCDPKACEQNLQMSDEFRKIGEGNINSVSWANSKYFIYIDGGLICKIGTNELYTRALYSNIVGTGIVVGKLPLEFDGRKDKFWINPQANRLLMIKANSVISVYEIDGTSSKNFADTYSKPFSTVKGSVVDYNLYWASNESEILWVNLVGSDDGKKKSCVYRLSSLIELIGTFEQAKTPALSPDGKKLAFGSGNHLFVYEIDGWKKIGDLGGEKSVSYVWSGNETIFAGGSSSVRKWTMNDDGKFAGDGRILFLSSIKSAFWKPGAENVVTAQSSAGGAVFYDFDSYKSIWRKTAEDSRASFEFMKKAARQAQVAQNGKFRVYCGPTDNLLFENAFYIRNLTGNGTTSPVFADSVRKAPARRRAALVFDALDSADGIPKILSVLNDYNIKATFFLNGEFIRRYPKETKQIVMSGHDCASMFFTLTDFNEKGFVIDEEFVRRGLARNEDEFFAATGSELSLMWHAPNYIADEKIKSYGEKSGYKYIDCGRLSLDTATLDGDKKQWYLSAESLVEFFVSNAEDKMVIPVSTGISKGKRNDFLYEKLSLLIGDLLDEGFEFTLLRNVR